MKKLLIPLGTVAAIVAPTIATISCGQAKDKPSKGLYITYWPDIDPAIALGADIAASSKSSGHFATWFPKGSKYENVLKGIKEIKPLWDADTMDEEYWRNINGGEKVNLVNEYWIKTPQKTFLKNESKINPIQFDYNAGIAGQKYEWEISNPKSGGTDKVTIENKGSANYTTPGDLWQIRDMGQILNTAAKALDVAIPDASNPSKYEDKAKEVIKTTNDHWAAFRKIQVENETGLSTLTPAQLTARQASLSSKRVANNTTGSSTTDPRLLILNIKTGAASAGSNDTIAFSTPSMAQEAYTKTHFTMPSLSQKQFDVLKTYKNLDNNGIAKQASETANGIYFPTYKGTALTADFWSEWNGDIDKLVVGISYKELLAHQDDTSYFYDLYNGEKNKAGSTGKLLTDLVGTDLTPKNTVFMDTFLAGSGSYGFRMPIGQNVFIDKISQSFYGYDWKSKI